LDEEKGLDLLRLTMKAGWIRFLSVTHPQPPHCPRTEPHQDGRRNYIKYTGTAVSRISSFHPMIEDWFSNNDCAIDIKV
jgi:hypothetical protein